MADIDHFKRVNNTGDEFGVLLPRASPHYAATIATRLCELLATRPLVVRGHPEAIERITLSIGVAGWHAGESGAEWYARADAALYEGNAAAGSRSTHPPAGGSQAWQLPAKAAL